uniref:Uncharacterized protein n=1 Tax=Anguilla anguilla TaxID=7936 RepID=A0A0E9TMH0_ANGAN
MFFQVTAQKGTKISVSNAW